MAAEEFVVIGGGLVGLSTAYQLLLQRAGSSVTVVEKEASACAHQSTHNSGVLHAGLSYKPGSAKARFAHRGVRLMRAFCDRHGVRYDICGKLIVATNDAERPRLDRLREQGTANGLSGLRVLTPGAARELEPHVGGVGALHVPEEGIVDYGAVGRALHSEIERLGGSVVLGAAVRGLTRAGRGWIVETSRGERTAAYLIGCAGLHADTVCRLSGDTPPVRIVPFRGEYYRLVPERTSLVRGLIYPLPDPTFPFLGVHLTRRIDGSVDAGPNAILALAREGYRRSSIRWRDSLDSLGFIGTWRFIAAHPRHTWNELRQSFGKRRFTRALQRLVPELRAEDLAPGGSGVRAQAMRPDGSLVQDFLFHEMPGALHVLNAPSPAATASLAIGEEIAARVLGAAGGASSPVGAEARL